MIKTLLITALAGGSGFAGWLGGSVWPAPPEWTDAIDRSANDLRAKLRLEELDFAGLRQLMPTDKFDAFRTQVNDFAVAAGEVIVVERDNGTLEEQLDNLALDGSVAILDAPAPANPPVAAAPAPPPVAAPDAATPAQPPPNGAAVAPPPRPATPVIPTAPTVSSPGSVFSAQLSLCPRMAVSNAPTSTAGIVTAYKPVVQVKNVRLATFPTPGACMSSGYGPRSDRLHKGLDYHADIGVPVLAGAEGTVLEIKYRNDYGNMILIDHGDGVYTRYAHLASFGRGLTPGVSVRAGEQLGLMGNTASYQIPMHLHYELLLGNYGNPKGSFGLEPVNPLSFPAAS